MSYFKDYAYRNYPIRDSLSLKVDDIPGAQPRQYRATKNTHHYTDKLTSRYLGYDNSGGFAYHQLKPYSAYGKDIPHGVDHYALDQKIHRKKQFRNNVHHNSEITQAKILERGDRVNDNLALFDFPRNLNTKDIPGAVPGTLQSKGVKNHDLSYKLRSDNLFYNGPENYGLQDRLNKYRVHRHIETPPNLRSQSHGRPSRRTDPYQQHQPQNPPRRYMIEQKSDIFNRNLNPNDNPHRLDNHIKSRAVNFPLKMTPRYDGLRNSKGPTDNYTSSLRNQHLYNNDVTEQTNRLSRSAAAFKHADYYNVQEMERNNNVRLMTQFDQNQRAIRTPIKNYHMQQLQAQQQVHEQQPMRQPSPRPQPQFVRPEPVEDHHPESRMRSEPQFDRDFREFYKDLTKVEQQQKPKTPIIPQERKASQTLPNEPVMEQRPQPQHGISSDRSPSPQPQPQHQYQNQNQHQHQQNQQYQERQERSVSRTRPESKAVMTDPGRSFRIGEAPRTNTPLKKLFVFDILANKPSIKLVPAKARVPSGYGFTMKPEANMNNWMAYEDKPEGGTHRRNYSNPTEMSARDRSGENFSRNNFHRPMPTEGY